MSHRSKPYMRLNSSLTLRCFTVLVLLTIWPEKVIAESCWERAGLSEDLVVSRTADNVVRFCDLYFYLESTTPPGGRSRALARPGAIHQAAENMAVIDAMARLEEIDSELDADVLAWRARDTIRRKRMNTRLTKLVNEQVANLDLELLAREYYAANPSEFTQPASVSVHHILIKAEERGYSAALREIERIQLLLQEGADFGELAEQLSEDDSAGMNKGRLGVIKPGQTYPTFEEAAFALSEPGQISPPVFTIFGIHLIRLDKSVPAETIPFEKFSSRLQTKLMDQSKAKIREQIFNEQRETLEMEMVVEESRLRELYNKAFSETE